MKKLFIKPNGQITLKDVRDPYFLTEGLLVKTKFALISSGTELHSIRMKKFQNSSLLKKLISSKEFRTQAYEIFKTKSLKNSIKFFIKYLKNPAITKNFSSPIPNLTSLGYSCSGIVLKSNIQEYQKNSRVVCSGSNHAEKIFSPKNLTCKMPENVSFEEGAFSTLGAIALHAIHRANIQAGEYIGIIGAGLIGLITVQLAKLNGAKVFAFDLINKRLNLAKKLGADFLINPKNYNSKNVVNKNTNNHGLDAIIICASSNSPKPLEDALDLIREKGKIVIVGAFPIEIDRALLYNKEADILISRSYGPGRYDPYYEFEGFDYPKAFVPWTEQRNIEMFLKLVSEKKLKIKPLISDIIPVDNAQTAYHNLETDPINNIAILLDFSDSTRLNLKLDKKIEKKIPKKLVIGLIGCGSFAQLVHLPFLINNKNCEIKGISTQSKKSAEICKEKYHPSYVTTNYKKILNDPEIDTVFIYTRHDTHAKFSIQALNSNKNVYCEKPMGLTMEECINVYNTVKKSEKSYTIGFNRRYSPLIKIVKDILSTRNNPIIINYRIANPFLPSDHWAYNPNIGGGPLIGEFCHFTDLVLYLIQSQPIELIAKGGVLSHKNSQVYDNCVVIIKFVNGSVANIVYTDLSTADTPKERIEIFCGDSSILLNDFSTLDTSGFSLGNIRYSIQDKGHENELNNVILSNLRILDSSINENDALRAMDLCFKTLESIKIGKSVKISGDLYN